MLNIVFDLDGTLCDDTHRQQHLRKTPKDWDAYFAGIPDDVPIFPTFRIFELMTCKPDVFVQIWTARPETYRDQTEKWLIKSLLHTSPDVLSVTAARTLLCRVHIQMRPEDDYAPSEDLKELWLAGSGHARPDVVFEDYDACVNMYRRNGVACFQVSDRQFV